MSDVDVRAGDEVGLVRQLLEPRVADWTSVIAYSPTAERVFAGFRDEPPRWWQLHTLDVRREGVVFYRGWQS